MTMKVNVEGILRLKISFGTKWDMQAKVQGIFTPYPLDLITMGVGLA